MTADATVKRPAAYLSSIGKSCGTPVARWLKLPDAVHDRKPMEQGVFFKAEHRIGHGLS